MKHNSSVITVPLLAVLTLSSATAFADDHRRSGPQNHARSAAAVPAQGPAVHHAVPRAQVVAPAPVRPVIVAPPVRPYVARPYAVRPYVVTPYVVRPYVVTPYVTHRYYRPYVVAPF